MSMQALWAAARRRLAVTASHIPRQTRSIALKADGYPQDFIFHPNFFSEAEQRILLSAALAKLDRNESRQHRRRRQEYLAAHASTPSTDVQSLFLPDEYYTFEQGHFDGVIRNFREMHVSAWPDEPELTRLLERLHSVHPQQPTQTHILHLASSGEILPHVDNLGASGSWIQGVSLGDARVLRLENAEDPSDVFEMLVPSGSVYLQRHADTIRYQYKHSILGRRPPAQAQNNNTMGGSQRLSIMIRDQHPI